MRMYFYCALLVLCTGIAAAQPMGGRDGERPERFDRFRKMKLIETLKLNEEDAARFVAKETAHSEAVRKLIDQRNDALDEMQKSLKDGGDVKGLNKPIDQVLALDDQIVKERRRYQDELRNFFPPDKFAKYLVFEREFGRGVRDAIKGMAREHRHDRD